MRGQRKSHADRAAAKARDAQLKEKEAAEWARVGERAAELRAPGALGARGFELLHAVCPDCLQWVQVFEGRTRGHDGCTPL